MRSTDTRASMKLKTIIAVYVVEKCTTLYGDRFSDTKLTKIILLNNARKH